MYPFERDNHLIDLGVTFGFFKEKNATVAIGNRIFETNFMTCFSQRCFWTTKYDVKK